MHIAENLKLELVTPERLLTSRAADMVVLPAADGEMGVKPGHSPVITVLNDGVVNVYKGDAIDQRFYVIGGFAEVSDVSCTLLAEKAYDMASADKAAIQTERDALAEELETLRYKKAPQKKIASVEARIAATDRLLSAL